jgi:membrane-bound lytic murein transglycosylase D
MRIDSVIDERLDPYIATEAAARLLAKNYELTGTWPLAITSYNHGAGGMQRAARTLGTKDMGEIVRRYKSRTFGFASRNFYASFLAASRVDRDAQRYFGQVRQDAPYAYETIEVPFYTPASQLAAALGVELSLLRQFNPALRPAVWEGGKYIPKRYALRLPADAIDGEVGTLLAGIPQGSRFAEQHRDRFHKVGRGETLSRIAQRYSVSESELAALNNLRDRHRIRVGQVLVLPERPGGGRPAPVTVAVAAEPQPLPADGVYRVAPGDTLGRIATRYGVSEQDLAAANGIRDRHLIAVGQTLRIPGATEPVVVASASAPEAERAKPEPAPERAKPESAKPKPTPAEAPVPSAPEKAPAAAKPAATPVASAEPSPPAAPVAPEPESVAPEPVAVAPEPESVEPEPAPPPAARRPDASPQDPSDYSVHGNRIRVQAAETLGHYAEWLETRASQLRSLNGLSFEQPVVIGDALKLDFARVSPAEFEQRRLEYHQSLQKEFFDAFVVTGTENHVLARGESLWYLAKRKYKVPVWLLRQYNPDLDFAALPAGSPLVVPIVEPRGES